MNVFTPWLPMSQNAKLEVITISLQYTSNKLILNFNIHALVDITQLNKNENLSFKQYFPKDI